MSFCSEEFTALLPRTDGAGAYGIAERLRADAATLSVAAADARINVTVSIGVACSASTATTCSSCSRPPTWRFTGPRTPTAIRFGYTPTPPGTLQKNKDEATDACP